MNNALKLLVEHKYYVRIQQNEDNSITVIFPHNDIMDFEETQYFYGIYDEQSILFGQDNVIKKYLVTSGCRRLAILCDIIVKCNARGIKRKLIVGFDKENNNVNNILSLIGPEPTDMEKEEKLFNLISNRDLNKDTQTIAEKEGLLKEYNEIVAIYDRRNGLAI